jgi:hypothetical protein
MECISASSRAISGRLANSKLFARLVGLVKVLNAIVALAAVGAFSFDSHGNNTLRVLAAVVLTCYCFETSVKARGSPCGLVPSSFQPVCCLVRSSLRWAVVTSTFG